LSLACCGLAACDDGDPGRAASPGLTPASNAQTTTATPSPTVSAAKISVSPADGTKKNRLDSVISVDARSGRLLAVTVKDGEGKKVPGRITVNGVSWLPAEEGGLEESATYRISATAVDENGLKTDLKSSFGTMTPHAQATAYLTPGDDWNVGVGMPIIVNLSKAVADDKRRNVEKAIAVTSKPATKGAWRWFTDAQLQWRPAKYWKSGTKVAVKADLQGVQFAKGVWGDGTQTSKFRIGSRMISTVDINAHTLTVRKDGKVLRRIPVTTGKPGFETRKGIKVIMSRESSRQMNSETTGIGKNSSEYYNVNVKWAMRLTNSGEFLHAAPWSVGSQGRANVSHGCTGMSTANAAWLFSVSKAGDVVKYKGGSRPIEWGNGYTAWNKTFKQWSEGS
jgi:lipoprotein-anchoring transpeptidase ErfK/SrfK